LDVEENFGLVGLLVVGENMDDALLDADEDAIRAVAGVGQQYGPELKDTAIVLHALPAGPLEVRKRNLCRDRHRRGVDFLTRKLSRDGCQGAGLVVDDEDGLACRIDTEVFGRLKAPSDLDRLLIAPGKD